MRNPLVLAAALAASLLASRAWADIPPPDDQVKSCVAEAVTRRVVAKEPALGPAPCRVVPPFEGVTRYPAEAMSKRDAEQKSAGYTWICPLTRSYRGDALYCKLPEGMTAEDALHGPSAPATSAPAAGVAESGAKRGCAGCATSSTTPAAPLPHESLGLTLAVGAALAAIRRRRSGTGARPA